jgi:NADH-quinone oxidoreductase subunit M
VEVEGITNILIISLALLAIVSSPVIYVLGRMIGNRVGWVVFIILGSISLLSVPLIPTIGEHTIIEEFSWTPSPLKLTSFVFGFTALYSTIYMKRRMQEEDVVESKQAYATYYTLYILYAGSVLASSLSTNLIQFYLFFESALVFSWLLVLNYGYGDRSRTSIMYFIWTHLGAVSLLLGIMGAFWQTGSFEIADLHLIAGSPIGFWIGTAMTLGILVKIGAFGFHGWLPNTYSESPAPVSAVLGATSVLLGTYTMARLLPPLREVMCGASGWFELWALTTILYAGIMALVQKDTKRLVAYLSMSQMNYCFLGVFTYVEHGVLGAISYSISHGLAIALLFLVSGSILYRTGSRNMDKLGGLAAKLPSSIIATLVGFLTIGGVPPSVGFKSKFILLTGAFERGFMHSPLEITVAILAASLATVITLAYEFRTVWRVFYGQMPERLQKIKEVPIPMIIALLALSALSIIMGIWPASITNPIDAYIKPLMEL